MSRSPRRRGGSHALSDSSRRRRLSIPAATAFLAQRAQQLSSSQASPVEIARSTVLPRPEPTLATTGVLQASGFERMAPVIPSRPSPSELLRQYLAVGGDVSPRSSRPPALTPDDFEHVEIRTASSLLETIFARPAKGRRWGQRDSQLAAPFVDEYSGLNAIRELLQREEAVIWMFMGDDTNLSLVDGRPSPASYQHMFADRLRWELNRRDDLALSQGQELSDVFEHRRRWLRTQRRFQPHVVFYMPTLADLAIFRPTPQSYLEGLRDLLLAIRHSGVHPILQTTWLFSRKHEYHRLSYALAEDLRQLASELDVPLIDHHYRWEQANRTINTERWLDRKRLAPDHVGQIALAMELFHELDLFEQHSQICTQERLLIC